ncbi:MAG TPA: methyltransferase domain-containing protein [Nitrososphaera sp.]|jgi:trans-aconitate methyltransferase|nr:methyltransferase domain-containing protein [Nitrososphaera sp.]
MCKQTAQLYDKKTSEDFYNERFRNGYMDEWPPEKKQRVLEIIRELGLPRTGEALDFGCGNGVFTEVIRLALPEWQVYGVDFSTVAVQGARVKHPYCTFFTLSDEEFLVKKYDFLFTHHVLEHVYDINEVWQEIVSFMKPQASALHILPCGNEGSFEHEICLLRVGGINEQMGNRFFFEDEGHVRRLNTRQLVELAANSGLELVREYYANQYYSALEWILASGEDFILMLTDPQHAKDAEARAKLINIRRKLRTIAWARKIVELVRAGKRNKNKTLRNWLGLIGRLPFFPLCRAIDWQLRRRAEAEWRNRKGERNGSEMYLYFRRMC